MSKSISELKLGTVNHEELKELIKLHWKIQQPMFTWGGPGIGKSDVHRQAAEEIAEDINKEYVEYSDNPEAINNEEFFVFIDTRLAQLDPSDLRGIPWVYAVIKNGDRLLEIPATSLHSNQFGDYNLVSMVTRWCPPSEFPSRGQGVWLFDELNIALEINQKSAYQLFLRRCLGRYRVPRGFSLFAAGNRAEDMCGVVPMPKALESRFDHIELRSPTVEEWTTWAITANVHPTVIGFLNWKRSLLNAWDVKKPFPAQPNPRTWEFCSNMAYEVGFDNLKRSEMAFGTAVGPGASKELVAFVRNRDKLPRLQDLFRKPKMLKYSELAIDLQYALTSSIAEYAISHRDDFKNVNPCMKVLREMIAGHNLVEMGYLALRMMFPRLAESVKDQIEEESYYPDIANVMTRYM